VVVLGLSLHVPAISVSDLSLDTRVFGFDRGVRLLMPVSLLKTLENDERSRQVSRPIFLDTSDID
jgi:hypothetical protein